MSSPARALPFEVEEFWEDLLAFIEDRRVIPIVGAELLTIPIEGRQVPLYQAVAERLLEKYHLSAAALPGGSMLGRGHELSDAVSALAAAGKRVKDLYRPTYDILRSLLAANPEIPDALHQLAAIRHFDLFVTTTSDDMLARALNAERYGGAPQTDQIEYAPKLPTGRGRDIPDIPPLNYTGVFYLFGKADASPFFAIHDEDALEFPYALQAGNAPERVFSQLRSRHLLLIGLHFPDWLSRFFLRLSNVERLFSDQRAKREFLVGESVAEDRSFNAFLQRYSQDSRSYPIGAREFVFELHRRWSERNPSPSNLPSVESDQIAGPDPAIFVSYAKEDIDAARRLHAELLEIAGDVAWIDKQALKSGDEWERRIKGAIQRCSFFLPLISANTERRSEGYFRLEWKKAANRSDMIQGRKFIFPIVVDENFTGMNDYALLPDQFKAFQFSHAPGGRLNNELRSELSEQIRMLRRKRTS
jgi:hypothetical protein